MNFILLVTFLKETMTIKHTKKAKMTIKYTKIGEIANKKSKCQ